MRNLFIAVFALFTATGCVQNPDTMKKPYVIEVTSFKYNELIDVDEFWKRDAKVEEDYTRHQPGFISRESGYSKDNNEVVVIVRWKTLADADASMNKFMADASVKDYASMINGSSMKMARYEVKE